MCTSEANEGGSDFCLSDNGKYIYAINSAEIRCYELKNLVLKFRIPTEEYMESIFLMNGHLYFGG